MRRRDLIVGVIGASLFGEHAGAAQQPGRRRVIGVLVPGREVVASFTQQLRARGYGDDDIDIMVRGAEGHVERLAVLAAELVRLSPDIIVSGLPASVAAANRRHRRSRLLW